jgi:zinc protease
MKRVEPVLRDWNPTQPRGKGLVRRPQDKEQAYIYLGTALPPPTDPAVPALHVMAEILSDRLGRNLREKQGLAYSVGATVGFVPETGWCYAAMGTRNENVEKARKGIGDEIEKLRQGLVKSEELSRVVNSYWGHLLRFHQTHIGQAYYLGLHEYLGNGYEYDLRFADELRRVTALDVQQAALKYLDPAQWLTMVVGDLERIDAGADK